MSTEIATRGPLSTNIEQVLIGGDLAQLKPDERLSYYNRLCESLGLNPLTQPFQYIVLNQKLQLYAKKDCTEQLRKIHGVSITSVDPKQIGDLLVVVASASDREGRVDSATGAVNVSGLKGENLANAMMKAETKSKRRVTLSLCGLGMLDETEVQTLKEQGVASEPQGNKWQDQVAEDVKAGVVEAPVGNSKASAISHEPDIQPRSKKGTPQSTQPLPSVADAFHGPAQPIQGEVQAEPVITERQGKMLFAISKSANLSDQDVKDAMAHIGLKCHRNEIPRNRFQDVLDEIDPQFKYHQPKGER
jgi:hypothetical protein